VVKITLQGMAMPRVFAIGFVVFILLISATVAAATRQNYRTHLTGDAEVPARETLAQGQAILQVSDSGNELHYKLIVANIENVTQAHIHLGAADATGGIVAWLYPSAPPQLAIPGRTDGVLAEGTITGANLVGTLAGHPLSSLLDAINSGNAYVNVHTNDFIAPTNTGPGDYPGGEVRGQIR
jgi:hypothetical protein